jgi:stage II sporulation protein D
MPRIGTSRAPAWRFAIGAAIAVLVLLAAGAPRAEAASQWVVKGAGYGHGVGMSQYGALGHAKRGFDYSAILAHYYSGTLLGTIPTQTVRVLLLQAPSIRFSGANSACGADLTESKTYVAKRKGSKVLLNTKGGGRVASCGKLLSAAGGFTVELFGKGSYRGALEIRAAKSRGRLATINAVDLEDYVRGVIARESPPSWPLEALKAQAVAARSYAVSSPVRGAGFDHYADTRSQVYGGAKAETTRTNQAVADTALQVVTYQGRVAQTFFFSTSGGYTEDNENSFLGGTPAPYLRGVPDPYEGEAGSPYFKWNRKFSHASMDAKLGRRVKGKLRNIVVTKRGASPRIVRARIVGSGGSTNISGPDLKAALGLPDTWAYFTKARLAPKRFRGSVTATLRAG